ncbi:MAG TPA: ATP-binding protein [Actinomycetota bacterium]|nr:ATP-binding protein [Actinomycetota bacterium]
MFESFVAAPAHIAIEFLGFLVMGGAALLALTRPGFVAHSPFGRLSGFFGFGVLAAAQVLHGGAFLQSDGADVLIALRAGGAALVGIALIGGLRQTPAAALLPVFELKEPRLLLAAAAALAVSVVAFGSALRHRRGALRLALGMLLLTAAEVLTAAAPNARFGRGVVVEYAYAAHMAKILGFLVLGAWLWTAARSSIRTRFVGAFVGLLVLVVLALSSALTAVIARNIERDQLARVEAQLRSAVELIEDEVTGELLDKIQLIADTPLAKSGIATRNRAALREGAAGVLLREPFEEDFLIFMNEQREILGAHGNGPVTALDEPAKPLSTLDLLKLAGSEVVADIAGGPADSSVSVELIGRTAVVIAAQRVRDPVDVSRPVGIAAMGRYIDIRLIDQITERLKPARASLVVVDRLVATRLADPIGVRRLLPQDLVAEMNLSEDPLSREHVVGSRNYFSAYESLSTAGGEPVGTLILSAPASIVAETRDDVTRTLFLVALGVAAIVLLLAFLSGRRIARPIQVLTAAAGAVREGNLGARAEVSGEDEVGQLGESFNQMTASLATMTDDLRDAAREEQNLRARIEAIVQSMADGLVAVDAQRRVLAFNAQAAKLTGVRRSQALGKPIESVLEVKDSQGTRVHVPIYDLAEGSLTGVFLARRGDDPIPIALTSAVLKDEVGRPTGAVAVFHDMSREREVERMKSEFLANISHELRTPLTPIKGYAQILDRKDLPKTKTKGFVKGILESTARLERIVELLVDFAAMEAGRLAPRTTPVDVGPIVESLVADWRKRSPNHKWVTHVRTRLPRVVGDERLLRRSLEEVLDNAVKFSPQGGTIRVEARATASVNGKARRGVQLIVSDDGIGMAKEDLPRIFSDFSQIDASETRTYGGLGLGLSFVQRIVAVHQGTIEVESEPDRGTSITITVPAVEQGKAAPRKPQPRAAAKKATPTRVKRRA